MEHNLAFVALPELGFTVCPGLVPSRTSAHRRSDAFDATAQVRMTVFTTIARGPSCVESTLQK